MTSFVHRDRRLALVTEAIQRLTATIGPLKIMQRQPVGKFDLLKLRQRAALVALKKEKAELQRDRYETSDVFVVALATAWLWDKTTGLYDAAGKDAALVALARQPAFSPADASILQTTPRTNAVNGSFSTLSPRRLALPSHRNWPASRSARGCGPMRRCGSIRSATSR